MLRLWVVLTVVGVFTGTNLAVAANIRITGTFTNLRYIQESGDLLGTEITIVPASGDRVGFVAFVQMAEGGAPYSALVPITVTGDKIQLSMPSPGQYAGLNFSGVVASDKLVGSWSSGEKVVLVRHASYWD